MPRISEKSEALQGVSTTIESTILIESSSEDLEDLEDDLEDLAIIYDVITSQRYRDSTAGRHADDSLEAYIRQYPETGFLALFRMHRSF